MDAPADQRAGHLGERDGEVGQGFESGLAIGQGEQGDAAGVLGRVAATDQDHAVGQGQREAVANRRWELADFLPNRVRSGQIEGEKPVVPDLLATVPRHRAVREIRPAAGNQVLAVDSGEGTGKADGIGHRRHCPDHRRVRMERAGCGEGGEGGGGDERAGEGG